MKRTLSHMHATSKSRKSDVRTMHITTRISVMRTRQGMRGLKNGRGTDRKKIAGDSGRED